MNVLELNGCDMGTHHFSHKSAVSMTNSISTSMHGLLLKKIKTENLPLGLILDGSTDSSNNHYIALLFQLLEDNLPKVHFYRLVTLGSKENADAMVEKIVNAFKEDNIFLDMKKKLVAFTSDGAR